MPSGKKVPTPSRNTPQYARWLARCLRSYLGSVPFGTHLNIALVYRACDLDEIAATIEDDQLELKRLVVIGESRLKRLTDKYGPIPATD